MSAVSSAPLHTLIKQIKKHDFIGRLAVFDPGETTGFAIFERGEDHTTLTYATQLPTWPIEKGVESLHRAFECQPKHVVYEAYHIYKWRLAEHTYSEVPTIQLIGIIKYLCILRDIPYTKQTALTGKSFCTDQKLEYWGLYKPGLIHGRDAIRHGCQFLLFGDANHNFDS